MSSAAKFGESEAGPGEASPIRQPDSPIHTYRCGVCGGPTIEPPSEADLAAWRDAPSGTASA